MLPVLAAGRFACLWSSPSCARERYKGMPQAGCKLWIVMIRDVFPYRTVRIRAVFVCETVCRIHAV